MIKLTIGIALLLGFLNNMLFVGPSAYESMNLVGQWITVLVGIVLIFFGLKKVWPKIKKEKASKISVKELLKEYIFDYKKFLGSHLEKKTPKFLLMAIWLFGVAHLSGNLDLAILKPGHPQWLDSWLTVWPILFFLGLILGLFIYLAIGYLYHLFVKFSGGKTNILASRRIFIYSTMPFSFILVLYKVCCMSVYGNDYFVKPISENLVFFWLALLSIAYVFSIYLLYVGIKKVHQTKLVRGFIFFVIVPAIYFMLAFFGIADLALQEGDRTVNYNNMAIQNLERGDYTSAEEAMKSALDNDVNPDESNRAQVLFNLATISVAKGELGVAVEYYEEILSFTDEFNAEYHVAKGKIGLLQQDAEKAIGDFKKAIGIEPDSFEANNSLGVTLLTGINSGLEEFAKALPYNKKAYELVVNPRTLENLAINLFALEYYEDAKPFLEELLILKPNDTDVIFYMATVEYTTGNITRTKELLRRAVEINPNLLTPEVQGILDN